ncbi:hypothetical protein [Pseudobdellovibrio exovorus]|nr:hypothetical protein [Pseudobdellovibrio exovorus]
MKLVAVCIPLVFSIFFSATSEASRARLQSLSHSYHVNDPYRIYTDVLQIHSAGSLVLIESGATNAVSGTDQAEALLTYTLEENRRLAFGIGHQHSSVSESRRIANALRGVATFELSQNPVYLAYGWKTQDIWYALGMYYSHRSDKVSGDDESTAGLTWGAELGRFQLYFDSTFLNRAQVSGRTFNSEAYFKGTANYVADNTVFYFDFKIQDIGIQLGAVEEEKHQLQEFRLGLVDWRSRQRNESFWGMEVISTELKCRTRLSAECDQKASRVILPVWLGFELPAAEWLMFRGSINQTVFVNKTKDKVGYPVGVIGNSNGVVSEYDNGPNSTQVALGAGLRFNRLTVDGTLATATTQVLDSSQLLSQVGITYRF